MFNKKNILCLGMIIILSLLLSFYLNKNIDILNSFYILFLIFIIAFFLFFLFVLRVDNQFYNFKNQKYKEMFLDNINKKLDDTIINDYILSNDESISTLLKLISDYIVKIESENKIIKNESSLIKEKLDKEYEEVLMFKNKMTKDILECINKSQNVEKSSMDFNDLMFEDDEVMSKININIAEIMKSIECRLSKNVIIKEHFDRINKFFEEVKIIYNRHKDICKDSNKDLLKILDIVQVIYDNIERQSLNILNTYIFSQYDSSNNKRDIQMDYDKEENIRNIKETNEKLKKDISEIKNIITFLHDKNIVVDEELNVNDDNGFVINNLINVFKSNYEITKNEKIKFQYILNTLMNRLKRIKYEYDNAKNMLLNIKELSRAIDKLNENIERLKK